MELAQLGFGASTIQRFFHTLRSRQPDFLSPETWLKHEASVGLRHLWLGQSSRGTAILVPVVHVHDEHGLRAMVSSIDGIQYVDQVNDLARALKGYRQQAIRLAGGAYCLVFLLLIWRYGTGGVVLLLPPLLSAVATVGALGLLGQPFHIIHCLSLLLVLGIGVDYTIFAAEFPKGKGPTTCLAMILSALTTLLSFGMLSLSHQAVLHALGLTTLIGVALVLLFVPIVLYRRT
jgi:predicted exporter